MTIQKLFEVKTKNLSQLGNVSAIDVISDYPEEFIRLLINILEKRGFSFSTESKKDLFLGLRDSISGTSLSRRNPLLDENNKFQISLNTKDLNNKLDITMHASGNVLNVDSISMKFTSIPRFSIKMKGMSANDVVEKLTAKIMKLKEVADKKITSREEWERDREELKKKELSSIEKNIERIAKKLGGLFFSETEGNRIKIVTRPSWKIIDIPEDILSKLKIRQENLVLIEYSYQFDIMKKIWSEVYKAIDRSNYKIITAGLVDYLWFEIEIVNPKRKNMKYNMSYQEAHEKMKEYIDSLLDKGREKAEERTISDIRRSVVKEIIEKDEI